MPYIALRLVAWRPRSGARLRGELPLIAAFTILAVYTSSVSGLCAIAFVKDVMIYRGPGGDRDRPLEARIRGDLPGRRCRHQGKAGTGCS
jgi:hypothetical protein